MNPDCAKGSHRACSGDGWDDDLDQPTPCPCHCHDIHLRDHRGGHGITQRQPGGAA
jgi:hypothetical protein